MFNSLQIYDRRERFAVGLADVALRVLTAPLRLRKTPDVSATPQRVLVVRLERIGDLLMAFDALATLRASLPDAQIDLVVGSWNTRLALAMGVANRVEALDAPWMVRGGTRPTWRHLATQAYGWRRHRYDLAINLEPDIRGNLLVALSGARHRVGFSTGGGGAVLTDAAAYDPTVHTRDNARRLIQVALGACPGNADTLVVAGDAPPSASDRQGILDRSSVELSVVQAFRPARRTLASRAEALHYARQCRQLNRSPGLGSGIGEPTDVRARLQVPAAARETADRLLGAATGSRFIGIHASGGRPIKQWHPDRFGQVATSLARSHGATIVLTGTEDDREIVRAVHDAIPEDVRVVDLCGQADVLELAGIFERLALLLTGDTGPMHLADAVGTPLVAVFGPSLAARYAPSTPQSRIVRVDLPCSPCNRIRLPPARCVGHVPDCLDGVTVEHVLAAARSLL